MISRKLAGAAVAVVLGGAAALAQAGPLAAWNFDTAWALGTTDTSGYGGGWVARSGSFNTTAMNYANGAAYGRSGGVAVITNSGTQGGNATSQFSGVRLLLVDGPGNPLADGYAFREAFETSMNKANSPYAQVDFWDDGSNVQAGLFALSKRPTDLAVSGAGSGAFNRISTSTAPAFANAVRAFEDASGTNVGSTPRTAPGWRTLRLELDATGDLEYYVDGILLGVSLQKYDTLTNAYDSAFSLLVGTTGAAAGASAQAVFDNFEFGQGAAVPEPGSLALASLALAGLGFARRRRA